MPSSETDTCDANARGLPERARLSSELLRLRRYGEAAEKLCEARLHPRHLPLQARRLPLQARRLPLHTRHLPLQQEVDDGDSGDSHDDGRGYPHSVHRHLLLEFRARVGQREMG